MSVAAAEAYFAPPSDDTHAELIRLRLNDGLIPLRGHWWWTPYDARIVADRLGGQVYRDGWRWRVLIPEVATSCS